SYGLVGDNAHGRGRQRLLLGLRPHRLVRRRGRLFVRREGPGHHPINPCSRRARGAPGVPRKYNKFGSILDTPFIIFPMIAGCFLLAAAMTSGPPTKASTGNLRPRHRACRTLHPEFRGVTRIWRCRAPFTNATPLESRIHFGWMTTRKSSNGGER